MKKILLINGSPRKGNCSLIFQQIFDKFSSDDINVETIDLRKLNLNYCKACQKYCEYTGKCCQNDGMNEILNKMLECDMVIIASPNYFQNVTALTKNFFDRTTPLYPNRKLRGKKLIFIFVGGLKCEITEETVVPCANGWARPMKLNWLNTYIFQASDINKFEDEVDYKNKMKNLLIEIEDNLKSEN